ncbi:MAG: hypothetical protein ACM3X9_02730 [Bacillota bacterium]
MLTWLRKDTFIKDIIVLILVSSICAGLFAMGFAMATDKYFAQAVTGIMGDFGEYDLLFQTKVELKAAMARQIREVIAAHFPGAKLKAGISVMGKASFFLTLPFVYKTKEVYSKLGSYFNNLPGNGGFSVMTEPRINITSVPNGIFDLLSRQIEEIPGVRFTFNDGGSIGIILKDIHSSKTVLDKLNRLLKEYQILEVRLGANYSPEDLITMGKKISQSLLGLDGSRYAQDITMTSGSDDYQYMVNTLAEIKKFLLAYTAEVKIQPAPGIKVEVGDLLVLNGQNAGSIKSGSTLEPLEVVVKVTSKDAAGVHGLIIQGDAGFLRDNKAFKLLPGEKIGRQVATIEVSDRKSQLVYAMDQGIKLLAQLNNAISDFNNTTGGPDLTVAGVEKAYQQLIEAREAMQTVSNSINGLTGKANRENLTRMVNLLNGIGDDLDYLAKTFGRVQILESRFEQVLQGLRDAQFFTGSSLLQNAIGQTGGIAAKMQLLDSQLGIVESALQARLRSLDDFINRFNPLVAVLVSWRNKAKDFAAAADNFGAVFTPGSPNHQKLMQLISSTNKAITNITGFDPVSVKSGLNIISNRLFGADKIDLSALIAELQKVRDSLPKLLDEEIGHSISLIDQYAGDDSSAGDSLQIFTASQIDLRAATAVARNVLQNSRASLYSLPVGTIQPDIRGELFKILAEVRSTIAALVIMILWVLSFILDQSLIISMLKMAQFSILPKRHFPENSWLGRGYRLINGVLAPAYLYAFGAGCSLMGITFALAGAGIPYLNYGEIGIIGGILGILISLIAEKINPVCKDEVMAGLSLGLPFKTIMREIVIPAGRPGMLQLLNRRKMIMK